MAGWEDRSDIFEAIHQTFDLEFARKHGTVCEGSPISRRLGSIVTFAGFDPKYDDARAKLEQVAQKFEQYRIEQENSLGYPIRYRDVGKDAFQLEVDVKVKVPSDYILMSQTKTVRRYYTSALKGLIREHVFGDGKAGRHHAELFRNRPTLFRHISGHMGKIDRDRLPH